MFYHIFKIRKVVFWQHFDNKPYSVYRSIGRQIALGVLAVSTLASAMPVPAVAEQVDIDAIAQGEDSGGRIRLGEIEVDASMASMAAGRQSRIVAVITREEIQAAPVNSLSDVLKLASSVDVRQRGGFGVQTDVSIDGGTYDQVTILLNGVNITSPQTGHYSADWPVNVDEIDRIEVLEGASSRIMGGSSLLGAINIVTRPKDHDHLSAQVEGGSYGSLVALAQGGIAVKDTRHQISGAYKRSDGGTPNSEFVRTQGFYHGKWVGDKASINWQAGASRINHGANTFYTGAFPNQHDDVTRYIASVMARTNGRWHIEPMAYFERLVDHYQLVHNSSYGENFHRTDIYGGRLNASTRWRGGLTTIGTECRHEKILSTALGSPMEPDKWVTVNDSVKYTKTDSRTNVSLYLEHNINLGVVDIAGGFVTAMNTGLDHKFRFYPGLDACYKPNSEWRILASWSRAFRMPTFTDLYYKNPTSEGNRDLKPEHMESWQIGANYEHDAVVLQGNAFVHHGHNMIDWVKYTADDIYHSAGFDLTNIGFTLSAYFQLDQLLGSRQPLRTLTMGYTYIHQRRHDDVKIYDATFAMEYLRNKFTAVLTHNLFQGASATWSLRCADRVGDYLVYAEGKNTGERHPYKPYAVLDLKIDYLWQMCDFFVNVSNLTNHRYYDFGNIPQPGLWIMAGVKVTIAGK